MTSPNLERLARSGELKAERFTRQEFEDALLDSLIQASEELLEVVGRMQSEP